MTSRYEQTRRKPKNPTTAPFPALEQTGERDDFRMNRRYYYISYSRRCRRGFAIPSRHRRRSAITKDPFGSEVLSQAKPPARVTPEPTHAPRIAVWHAFASLTTIRPTEPPHAKSLPIPRSHREPLRAHTERTLDFDPQDLSKTPDEPHTPIRPHLISYGSEKI
jgi:hypothetical protein